MPQRCWVPECSYGYGTDNGPRKTKYMFCCSDDSPLRAAWEAAIARADGIYPKIIWCCEDHFRPADIVPVYTPGTPFQTKVYPPELRQEAVPSVFPGRPSHAESSGSQDSSSATAGSSEHAQQGNSEQNPHGISAQQRKRNGYGKRKLLGPKIRDPGADIAGNMLQPSTSHNLQKKSFSGSRIPKRRRDQNICDSIYCDDCGEFSEEPCWYHVSHIENTPVVPLALASLPDCLMIDICNNSHEKGVFSRNSIYPQTLFGPMVGALCSSTAYSPFGCRAEDGSGIKRFHLDSDNCCNWLRYVRFAKNKQEQNLMACLHDGEVYFVVTKEIQADAELKVGYSRSYAEMLKECPEPIQQSPEPVEPVGLPADWEPEIVPVEIVEPVEIQPDPVEHQSDEEVNPLVRRSKRKHKRIKFYAAEEDEADDSESNPKEMCRKFTDPRPCLPTDEGLSSPPVDDFSVETLSTLINPDLIPDLEKKPSKTTRKGPAMVIKFPCTECPFQFPSEDCLIIHSLWHDSKEMDETDCPECGLSFDEFNLLGMHVKLHATKYEPQERCRFCDLFIATSRMDGHMQTSHPLETAINAILGPSGSDETSASAKEVNVFECDDCQIYFPSEPLLTLHSRQHSGLVEGLEQKCPACNIIIDDAAQWIQHINGHGTKNFPKDKCRYCPCSVERGKMDFHVRYVHPDHYGRAAFPCDICGVEKPTQQSLRNHHAAKHQAPQCTICAKIEESPRTLSQHVLTHQQADGFHCPHCTRIFVTYPPLNTHINDVHLLKNARPCPVCNKSMRNQGKLNHHMKTHSATFEYVCEWCGKGFHTKSNLQAHLKCMHKDAVPAR